MKDEATENVPRIRQGRTGRPVLYVLIAGLILVVVGWAAIDIWFNARLPG